MDLEEILLSCLDQDFGLLACGVRTILGYGGSNQIFQRRLVDLVGFMEVNCSRFLCIEPCIEELAWVRKICALEEVHLHISLESTHRYNQPIVRKHRSVPLALFGDLGISFVDDLTKFGYCFAALVR